MERQMIRFIAISIAVCALPLLLDANPITQSADVEEEQKILEECQNSDYRTYIKCLKRQRRHHFPHSDGYPEIDSHCMETCLKQCDGTKFECEKSCSYCYRRTKHRHQIITEYETECVSGNCNATERNLPAANITTKIDINNIINVTASTIGNTTCCPHCVPPVPCPPHHPPHYPPHIPPFFPPFFPPYFPPTLFPQLTIVPQLSLGLGLGLGFSPGFGGPFGCPYPGLCPTTSPPDCSGCGNPFLRYKCDVTCFAYGGNHLQDKATHTNTPCIGPYCVGGT